MAVGKVAAHLCLTLIIKESKFSVEQYRVVTTLNVIKHKKIIFSVVTLTFKLGYVDMNRILSLCWAC